MDKKKVLKQVIGWLLAGVIIFILFNTIYNNRDELTKWEWDIQWGKAILAVIILFIGYIAVAEGWREILYGFGHKIKFHEAFRVVYLAQLGRYIPGKIWQVIGMVGLAREIKIPSATSLASFALAQAYGLPAAFILIIVLLWGSNFPESLVIYRNIVYLVMGIVFFLFLILFFMPRGLEWALNKVLKLIRQPTVKYRPGYKNRISILFWYLLTWFSFGISFHFFLGAILVDVDFGPLFSAGTYIAAYNLAYIVILSPGGLGVREGVISALLTPYLGGPIAASVSLIHRVFVTLAEGCISLMALLTYRIKTSSQSRSNGD